MKYEVEITNHTVYVVEADSSEEARELVINGCGTIRIDNEIEDIAVSRSTDLSTNRKDKY